MLLNQTFFYRPQDLTAIEKAISYVSQNPSKAIKADHLSIDYQIPIKKLQSAFMQMTGHTVHDYLLKVKLIKARTLLHDLDIPLKEISRQLGFKHQSHFGRFFKKYTGFTPNEYRFKDLTSGNVHSEIVKERQVNKM